MSREILFRAKGTETGICRYGYLIPLPNMNPELRELHIFDNTTQEWYKIDPSTVCQYAGLKDKNGAKIFEGDILEGRLDDDCPDYITRAVAEWLDFGWAIRQLDCDCDPDPMDETDIGLWTVIGNVFDSPEMLEDAAKYADQDGIWRGWRS